MKRRLRRGEKEEEEMGSDRHEDVEVLRMIHVCTIHATRYPAFVGRRQRRDAFMIWTGAPTLYAGACRHCYLGIADMELGVFTRMDLIQILGLKL